MFRPLNLLTESISNIRNWISQKGNALLTVSCRTFYGKIFRCWNVNICGLSSQTCLPFLIENFLFLVQKHIQMCHIEKAQKPLHTLFDKAVRIMLSFSNGILLIMALARYEIIFKAFLFATIKRVLPFLFAFPLRCRQSCLNRTK
jgi:hypothetical protein